MRAETQNPVEPSGTHWNPVGSSGRKRFLIFSFISFCFVLTQTFVLLQQNIKKKYKLITGIKTQLYVNEVTDLEK